MPSSAGHSRISWFKSLAPNKRHDADRARAATDRALTACAVACEDAMRGYLLSAWSAHDADLHDIFVALAGERERQGQEIEDLLGPRSRSRGNGSQLALARRIVLEIYVMFGHDDRRILRACLRLEAASAARYRRARATLEKSSRTGPIQEMIDQHMTTLDRASARLENEIRVL